MTIENVPMPEENQQPSEADALAKPKRTRRAKPAAETPELEQSVSEAVPAKRAPARRKKAVAEEAVGQEGEAPVAASADAAPVAQAGDEPAPKPKRAPRKKVAPAEAVDVGGEAAAAPLSAEPETAPAEGSVEAAPHGYLALGPDLGVGDEGDASVAGDGASDEAPRERKGRDDERRRGGRDRHRERDTARQAAGGEGAGEAGLEGQAGAEGEAGGQPSRRAAMAAAQASEVFAELLSGDFDQSREEEVEAESEESAAAYKRVLRPEPDAPKLQKVLAQAGVGSRRDIEQMIEDGRIEVNDQVAHVGQRVSFGDRIKVAGRPIKVRISPPPARILAYHKPVGEVVTHDDPQGRPTVFRRLPKLGNGKWMSVGRLDLNTEGLLLFTNSGELANQLMHPRFGVEREYAVRVLGALDDAARDRLLSGVEIEGQKAAFLSISQGAGEGVNQWYRVVIAEGRNREVRKLFDAVGLTVNRLIRVRYGAIVLPRGLKRGVWVELGESDVRAVKSLAGMDRQEFAQGQGQGRQGNKGQQNKAQQGGKGKGGRGQPQQGGQQGRGSQQQGGGRGDFAQRQRPQDMDRSDRADRAPAHHDADDDLDHIGPIPNPLEQTFDRRFAKGSKRITAGFGRPDQDQWRQNNQSGSSKQKGPRQPDPMQTSVGYIGADAFFGKSGGGGGGGGRGRR